MFPCGTKMIKKEVIAVMVILERPKCNRKKEGRRTISKSQSIKPLS